MTWTILIPVKRAAERKQRLASVISEADRVSLSEQWLAHVIAISGSVGRVILLTPEPLIAIQNAVACLIDGGQGLNEELTAARAQLGKRQLAIVHADLPILEATDLHALCDAAERSGGAIAPDRHGRGTNALALADDRPFHFAFGEDSFASHCAAGGGKFGIVERRGLALDIDTPADSVELSRILNAPVRPMACDYAD